MTQSTLDAPEALLAELDRRGIRLWTEGDRLRFRAPEGQLEGDLKSRLVALKEEVKEVLRRRAGELPLTPLSEVVPHPEERHRPFPLTDIQQAYWLGQTSAFELGNAAAHLYLENDVRPQDGLDLERLNRAWRKLIQRHEMLRMVVSSDGQQRILEEVPPFSIETTDFSHLGGEETEAALASVREGMSHQGPSTDVWPLFEVRASLLANGHTRLHISLSLMLCDAHSFGPLYRDLLRFYRQDDVELPDLELSYRDYVLALREHETSEAFRRSLKTWQDRLDTLPGAPDLPLAKPPSSLSVPRFVRRHHRLSPDRWRRFKERARSLGLTPNAVLCCAYAEVLATWSRQRHFVINLLFFNREPLHPQIGEVVGNFSSTILLEIDHTVPETFESRARRLQQRLWQDIEHSRVTGVRVLRELHRHRGQGGRALMPIVFASTVDLQGGGGGQTDPEKQGWVYGALQTPQVWLDHQAAERAGALVFNWDAVEELFPAGMLETLFGTYCALLDRLATEPDLWGEVLPGRVPSEQLERRQAINATSAPVSEKMLHELVFEAVERDPGRLAVVDRERRLTYGELWREAVALAELLEGRGAGPGHRVAVVMEKGWQQVVSVLGVLEAGAAYLPVDAALPEERVAYLLEHGQCELALTQPWLVDRLPWPATIEVVPVEAVSGAGPAPGDPATLVPPRRHQRFTDLAYIIYTSGSTGLPKGVMIDHRGAVNTILDVNQRLAVGPEDRVLALSALNFDLSVWDVFGLLAAGGAVVLPSPEDAREPERWRQLVEQEGATLWNSVPALLAMLVDHLEGGGQPLPPSLRQAMLSGDWIPVDLPERIWRCAEQEVAVLSMGGATEASIWSILYPIEAVDPEWVSIPYGRPMVNQTFHVLDPALDPCPDWVPGELYIGGIGVALGYWGDEERTRHQFLEHPTTGERLYRTGDLGRYLPSGDIEFLGREDFQVKIQGYRIELGEIEAALLDHPAVREAVVVARGERRGSKRLVGYVVLEPDDGSPAADDPVSEGELQRHLRSKVPEYMVPTVLMTLESLPLSANGKVDRKALPEPGQGSSSAEAGGLFEPRDALEAQLVELWQEVLGRSPIGIGEGFFELGGDSLMAVRLMARIAKEVGRQLPLATLFERPTLADLADALREVDDPGATTGRSLVPIHPVGSRRPFFCVHPVGGQVLCYTELARSLSEEQPFYGLQAPEPDSGALTEWTLEGLAAHYLEQLRAQQPEGPWALGGWSMGGVVAFEMARQLRAAGEQVERLILIDATAPSTGDEPLPDDATLASWFLRDLGRLVGQSLDLPASELAPLSPEEQLRRLAEEVHRVELLGEMGEAQLGRHLEVFRRNYRALLTYRPSPDPGAVDLVWADLVWAADEDNEAATPAAWSRWATVRGQRRLEGDHYTLLQAPRLAALAAVVEGWLSDGQEDPS